MTSKKEYITPTIDALTQCFPDLDRATLEDYAKDVYKRQTLKSTVSILKAAEREALEDENQSPKRGESSPVDDIPNLSLIHISFYYFYMLWHLLPLCSITQVTCATGRLPLPQLS